MNINFHVEKDDKTYKVSAFPKIISAFLSEDIYSYQQDTDTLTEKMLLMENLDFQLSPNQRLITDMRQHTQEEVTDRQLLDQKSETHQINKKVHQDKRTRKQRTSHQNPTKRSKDKDQQAVAHLEDKQTLIFSDTVPIENVLIVFKTTAK